MILMCFNKYVHELVTADGVFIDARFNYKIIQWVLLKMLVFWDLILGRGRNLRRNRW